MAEMKTSLRPKARPKNLGVPRPKARPADLEAQAALQRANRAAQRDGYDLQTLGKKAKGGKISEYGGKEKYASKAAQMKHEKAESPATERREKKMATGGFIGDVKKRQMKARGTGAATKGTKFYG